MSDVQIAVVDQQDTQIVLAVPGVQGATGSEIPTGGTADQVLRKSSSTNYDTNWSQVTSAMIADGTIVNADINASAAIAGTKISPDFGSQNVTTTGTSTAASFIPTSSTVPTNGVYLPAANSVALSTNGTGRLFVDSSGRVGVGSAPSVGNGIHATINTNNYGTALVLQNANVNGWAAEMQFLGITTTDTQAKIGAIASGPGLNSGALAFYTANAGSYSERLRITSAGLVGIGTSSPGGLLHVSGGRTLLSSSDGYELAFARTGNYFYWYNDGGNLSGKLSLTTSAGAGGGEIITFTQDTKRVGIGTTSPENALHVNGSIQTGSTSHVIYSSNFGNYSSASDLSLISGSASLVFKTGASDTERARIDTSGRLLVGTSSARQGTLFEIESTSGVAAASITRNSNNSAGPSILLAKTRSSSNGVSSFGKVSADDSLGGIDFYGADGAALINAASIYAYADGEFATSGDTTDGPGRLVFSTTADGASSPTERMRIGSGGHLYATCSDTALASLTLKKGAAGADGIDYLQCRDSSNTAQLVIASNGNVTNTNNSYGALSDIKLKENIVDANSQWNDIKALQVRNYNFKEGQTHTQIGLIAQEVELVSPGLVSESPDRDAEGNDLGTVTKSVNYSVLYMKAVKALQEAMERIETLEAKVAALEGA